MKWYLSVFALGWIAVSLSCKQSTALLTPTASPTILAPTQITTEISSSIIIGTEYIAIDNPRRLEKTAQLLSPIGLQMAKPLPENFSWGNMQPAVESAIDFTRLDNFIKTFQSMGFSEFLLALKSGSPWAAKDGSIFTSKNISPKKEHMAAYEKWVYSIVERYDLDGKDDMPGLRFPVHYYEIGSEFSSYEPEPVADYLEMLSHAYEAAHRASSNVIVTHAAFLTTLAFRNFPNPEEYETAFAGAADQTHSLGEIRQVLDHPEIMDAVNIHSLGDPYEIESIVEWLQVEMSQRGYRKDIMISDTGTTPFIAWGPATSCNRLPNMMGKIVPPATETDRCRLAGYFQKLVAGDEQVLRWTQSFIAEDVVKRVVVAAEQGIILMNTAFTEDLVWLKLPIAQASAGTAAWAGLVDVDRQELRPVYYALQQLIDHIHGYQRIQRVSFDNPRLRVYELTKDGQRFWIAWFDTGSLILPGDPIPETTIKLDVNESSVIVESLIIQSNQTIPERVSVSAEGGSALIQLSPRPIFIQTGK